MDLTQWPFLDSCPRESSPGHLSKIPAWATVGLDIPQEELAAFLRSQTEARTPVLAQVVDLLSQVWAPLLAVTLVAVAVYDAYRSFRGRKGREEEKALSDQLRRSVALRSRLEDMALRLQALEEASRAVRAQGIRGLCPLHHHLRQGGAALPTSLSGEGRVGGSPFTAADGL